MSKDNSPSIWSQRRAGLPGWLTNRLWYFLPLITPLAVMIAFGFFYGGLVSCWVADGACTPLTSSVLRAAVSETDQTQVANYVAKAMWALVSGLYTIACVAGLLTAATVMHQALSDDFTERQRRLIIGITIILSADASLVAALFTVLDVGSPAQQLLRATVAPQFGAISLYMRGFESLGLTAALSLAAAACATIWQKDVSPAQDAKKDVSLEQDAKKVALRLRLLNYLLYVGAILLILGVLRMSKTLDWETSFIPLDSDVRKLTDPLVTGIVTTMGTTFTMLMAGIYLPAVLILRSRARKLAASQTEPEPWLKNRGLSLSFMESLPRLLAILGPMIAGPIFQLLQTFLGPSSGVPLP